METGYIKLWRKTLDSGLLQNPHAFQLFGYLLLQATHKQIKVDVRGENIVLNPGELLFGRKNAANELRVGEQVIRTALKYLKKNEILTIRATKRFSIISFVNWHAYQESNRDANQQTNHELTMSQPSANHELTTKQECKNINNINTLSECLSESADSDHAPAAMPEDKNPVVDLSKPDIAKPGKLVCPQRGIIDSYHVILPELPKVRKWRANHATALRTRWLEKWEEGKFQDETGGLQYFQRFFQYVRQSDWLMGRKPGRDGRAFHNTLAWMVQAQHFDDIISGKYHDRVVA